MPIGSDNAAADAEISNALADALSEQPAASQDVEAAALANLIPKPAMGDDEVASILSLQEDVPDEVVEPKQAYVFHTARPHLTVYINSKAREHAKNSMHGHVTHKRGEEGHNLELKFEGGRFVTFDPEFAALIQFCIKQWPKTYGCITAGHTAQAQLAARIERVRAEGTRRQLQGMIGLEGEDALLHHANRANTAGQTRVAEALLLAAEQVSTAAGALVHRQGTA